MEYGAIELLQSTIFRKVFIKKLFLNKLFFSNVNFFPFCTDNMDFTHINNVGKTPQFLPTVHVKEIEKNKSFKVTRLARVTTKWGPKILVDLDDVKTIYLPVRAFTYFQENPEEFTQMVNLVKERKVYIRFLGGSYNPFEFSSK